MLMKLFLTSTFIFLILGEVTRSHFVEFKNRIHQFPGRREATRWSRKIDYVPDSLIPKGKSNKLSSNSGNGKNIKPTKRTTKASGKTGMWGKR